MTQDDRRKWDARYAADPGAATPSAIIVDYWHLASVGKALDIACGNGRNSIFLAARGFAVDAVDISTVATDRLARRHPDIHVVNADLDHWSIPVNRYDLIVNIRFLDRRLLATIADGLKSGGVLIVETFVADAPDKYCLQSQELRWTFPSLRVVDYREQKTSASSRFDRTAHLVAVKPDG